MPELMSSRRFHFVELDDRFDSRVQPYLDLKSRAGECGQPLFIAEGKFVVERMIRWQGRLHSLFVAQNRQEQVAELLLQAGFLHDSNEDPTGVCNGDKRENLPVYVAAADEINRVVGFQFHSGILGCGYRPDRKRTSIARLCSQWQSNPTSWLLGAPETAFADNLGAMIRHAAAFSADGVLVGPRSVDPWSRRVIRVSMGNVFKIPVLETPDFRLELHNLRSRFGYRIIGTALDTTSIPLTEYSFRERCVILFGGEGYGLDQDMLAQCDDLVQIPMRPDVDSLNVATSAAIVAYELRRQLGGVM